MSILRSLAATDPEFVATKQVSAQTLNANRGAPLKLDNELNALHDDVHSSDNFNAARFADHLCAFRSKL